MTHDDVRDGLGDQQGDVEEAAAARAQLRWAAP
jgi:hypothetical protein